VHTDGTLHNGYSIRLQGIDTLDCKGTEAKYQAWHKGGRRVLIKVPTESLAEEFASAGSMGYRLRKPRILEAYNVARNEMLNSEDRASMYFLLEFPQINPGAKGKDDIGLNNSILSPNARNGKIAPDLIPVKYKISLKDEDTNQVREHIQARVDLVWDICITELTPRSETSAPETNELEGQLTSEFGGLYVTRPAAAP